MIRVWFDGALMTDIPKQWEEFRVLIVRSFDDRLLRPRYPQEVIFFGDCYKYIYNKFTTVGFNGIISVRVEVTDEDNKYRNSFNLRLFINDCTITEHNGEVRVILKDDTWLGRLELNRSSKIGIAGFGEGLTKSGLPMPKLTSFPLRVFDVDGVFNDEPSTQIINIADRTAYDTYETLKAMVRYYTDNEAVFVSTWYETLTSQGEWGDYTIALVSGRNLRTTDNYSPYCSFQSLINNLCNLYNLNLIIETTADEKRVRLEDESYILNSTINFTIVQPEVIEKSFFQELFFTNVKVGDPKHVKWSTDVQGIPDVPYIGFATEEYAIDTNIGLDLAKDLTVDCVIDHNAIQEMLQIADSDSLDDEYVMIVNRPNGGREALRWEFGALGQTLNKYFYNNPFSNKKVLERYTFYGQLKYQQAQLGSLMFSASMGATETLTDFSVFGNNRMDYNPNFTAVSLNDGTNYDETSKYVIPVDGVYTFEYEANWKVYDSCGLKLWVILCLGRGTGTDSCEKVYIYEQYSTVDDSVRTGKIQYTSYYTAGQEVFCKFLCVAYEKDLAELYKCDGQLIATGYNTEVLLQGGTFKTISTPYTNLSLGGIDANVQEYKSKRNVFTKSLTYKQINDVIENPTKALNLQNQTGLITMWNVNTDINLITGETKFTTLSQ